MPLRGVQLMNRLLTTLLQIAIAIPAGIGLRIIYLDIKQEYTHLIRGIK
jgi:hypothetical protein